LIRNADLESKDKFDQTMLSWAARNGHEAIVKLLLDKNADVESKDKLARHRSHGLPRTVIKLLLDKNADIESKDKFDRTPLPTVIRR
jgi:ankyrin repeat protein